MKPLAFVVALFTLIPSVAQNPQSSPTYTALKQEAEKFYAEKSFARAHEVYEKAQALAPSGETRWVAMRLADTASRLDVANPTYDTTRWRAAIDALEAVVRESGDDHDRVWAEAQESLGDAFWTNPRQRDFNAAQSHYAEALDWWAGSPDLALARRRYLAIVFRMAEQQDENQYVWRGAVPIDVLRNAVAIADVPANRAHAEYLLASQLLNGAPDAIERGLEMLDDVIRLGKATDWYDDALYLEATHLAHRGRVVVKEDGSTSFEPDYVKALNLAQRLTGSFTRSETRYYGDAFNLVQEISAHKVTVMVGATFLPKSEQEIAVSWRNVGEIEFRIATMDLASDAFGRRGVFAAVEFVPLTDVVRHWTIQVQDKGDHVPGTQQIRVTPPLPPGAYIVEAAANGSRSRQFLLVTQVNIVGHQSGRRTDVFVTDAVTGTPVAGSRVRAWYEQDLNRRSEIGFIDTTVDANGLASIAYPAQTYRIMTVVASAPNGHQAYWVPPYYFNRTDYVQWKLYAFTDRPAYRPGDTVKWKFIARARENEAWRTPAGETFEYQITGPRGEKVAKGSSQLNQFGSFWSELPLTSSMPLGEYTIHFFRDSRSELASATLFRLEEYKLPEFRVEVSTPEKKQFRSGDTVEVTIQASYYFGGPVANATVDAIVMSRPFVRYWSDWRVYPWYYLNPESGGGHQVNRETLKTDADGRAILRIETSQDDPDAVFTVNAHVTDASRREVAGTGTVRVTRQRYSVMARPTHYLFRPGDNVTVEFKAADANDRPVEATGTVKVTRRRWAEVWVDASGREISGRDLERVAIADRAGWQQTFAGYRDEEILTTKVSTDASGDATLSFAAPDPGYYSVRWASEDRDPGRATRVRDVVTAETTVWVTRTGTFDLWYHAGGIEIIADKESFRSGRTAQVMIVTPASGRWIMFTSSSTSILSTQVLHLDGTVKVIDIPLDDRHVPSFYLTASSVFDRTLSSTSRQIMVPPVEHFIDVDVKADRSEYEPRQDGTVTISTRDVDGKPVAAEVAVSVSDESVTAIQKDPAGDPREFFFGELSAIPPQVGASVQSQRYAMLVERDGKLIDTNTLKPKQRRDAEGRRQNELEKDEVAAQAAPPPAAAKIGAAVAEAITVTAEQPLADTRAVNFMETTAATIEVRSDFRSTAFWQPDVITGPDGTATIKVKFPEALTTWRAMARAVTPTTQVGIGSSTTRTNLPLIVRLQAPRFFVAGDRTTVSAVINNNTDRAMSVTPSLDVEGLVLSGAATAAAIDVPAHGESRADWNVVAKTPGAAKLRVTGRASERGDAMEKTFTVYPHGVDKLVARSGKLRGEEAVVKLTLPHERRATSLTVQIQPSLAVTMLDALPYLIDYPYGCTEQTMSRFLPAAIVARTLERNGLDRSQIEGRVFGGIERQSAATTHPKGERDLRLLDDMTTASMNRLYGFQHGDGGWGWWQPGDSDPFMTAYVVWGFAVAREGGLAVRENVVDAAVRYLDVRLVEYEKDWQMQSWLLHAAAAWRRGNPSDPEKRAFDNVWAHRERLTAYSRALLALAAHDFGDRERAAVMVRNLEDGANIDRTPDKSILLRGSGSGAAETLATAHWGEERSWWRWFDGPVESTAFALQAIVRIDPKNSLVEPAMNWLVKNRRGAQWNNTRDTAIAILALTDYLRASGELSSDVGYELMVNDRIVASNTVRPTDILGTPPRFTIEENLVRDTNEIRVRRTAGDRTAPIYFAVEGRFVSLEEPVTAAGHEIFVRRDYFRLAPHPTLLKGVTYDREPLRDGGTVNSGEGVDVTVTIETKNDYDYLMFEDLKPAGFEATSLQSGFLYAVQLKSGAVERKFAAGEPPAVRPSVNRRADAVDQAGQWVPVYQELRDRNVALFIDHLPQGTWEIRYTLRAEVPGQFHALPLIGQAMYVPEIRGNSDEVRVTVMDTKSE